MAQGYQGNKPQQQTPRPQTTTVQPPVAVTAPGTTIVVSTEEAQADKAAAAVILGTEVEDNTDCQLVQSLQERFTDKLVQELHELLVGAKSPLSVKVSIRDWWMHEVISTVTEAEKQELIEAARHVTRQVEEIVNEVPVLLM